MERRTVLRAGAVAWTAPAIAAATAAPAFAASTTWAVQGIVSDGGTDTYSAALTFQQGSPAAPALSLTFTLSGGAIWRTSGNSALSTTPTGWSGAKTSSTVLTYAYTGTTMPPVPATFGARRNAAGPATLTIQLLVDGVASGAPIVYTS